MEFHNNDRRNSTALRNVRTYLQPTLSARSREACAFVNGRLLHQLGHLISYA